MAADPAAPSTRAGAVEASPLAHRTPLDAMGGAASEASLPHVVLRPLDAGALTALIARTIAPNDASALAPDAMVQAMNKLLPRSGDALRARIALQQRQAMSPAGHSGPWLDPTWWKAGATVSVPRLDAVQRAAQQPHASATAASNALHQVLEQQSNKLPLFHVRMPVASTAQRMRTAVQNPFSPPFDGPPGAHAQEPLVGGRPTVAPASAGAARTVAQHDAMQAAAGVVARITESASLHVAHAPWLEAISFLSRKTGS